MEPARTISSRYFSIRACSIAMTPKFRLRTYKNAA
jgi:hypothetical protein